MLDYRQGVMIVPGAHEGVDDSDSQGLGPCALVIDRQPLFLAAMSRLLGAPPLNAEVLVTTRSTEAVEILQQNPVEVVVCDVMAEPTPGAELAGALASRTPSVKVILLADAEDKPASPGGGVALRRHRVLHQGHRR
jgi:CheY-like chemotaxis protein